MIEKIFSQPYIIIGVHRSGTSLLADVLIKSGIFLGNDLTDDKESRYFQQVNMMLFDKNGFDWTTPGVPFNLNGIVLDKARMIRDFVLPGSYPAQMLRLLFRGSWGWKDPRNTFTLNYWLKIFPHAKVIHIYRNGMDVALSLYNRNARIGESGKEDNKWYRPLLENKTAGLDLWEKYVAQAFSYKETLGDQILNLKFENLIAGDTTEIKKLETFTGLSLSSTILNTADKSRTGRYRADEHKNLVEYAKQNQWLKKLGYV